MLRIPDKVRVFFSKKYLDWAEKLPRFGGGTISWLQEIREYQRRDSEDTYKRTRPPQGTEIEFLYFRLVEMFHIEEFTELREGLLRLLPGLEDSFRTTDFLAGFRRDAETISGGSYRPLGIIARKSRVRFIPSEPFREMAELPTEVDYIGLKLHKALPSAFIITLDVHLTKEATQQLIRLQDRHYLPTVRFKKLIPRGMLGGGHSEDSIEGVMQQEILGWVDRLRASVEGCINPFLNGYFIKQSSDNTTSLPVVEVYALRGVPESEEAFGVWLKEAHHWWRSLGFGLYPFDAYKGENLMFIWPQRGSSQGETAHRLVVLWEPYVRSINTRGFGSGEKGAVVYHTEYFLNAMVKGITVLRFLELIQRNVEKLRKEVFGSMNMRRFSRYRMGAYIRLNDTLQRQSMLLDRISLEFDQQKNWILRDMNVEKVAELKNIETVSNSNPDDRNLRDVIFEAIQFRRDLVKNHLSLIKTSFSEYLVTRNMEAMYQLQRSIFWLTIIITIATITGLVASWQNMQAFLRMLLPRMNF